MQDICEQLISFGYYYWIILLYSFNPTYVYATFLETSQLTS